MQHALQFVAADGAVGRVARFRREFHAVADEVGFVVYQQEGVARKLFAEGGGFGDAVVVADVQAGGGRQGLQLLQAAAAPPLFPAAPLPPPLSLVRQASALP